MSHLAKAEKISVGRASQELRRLQSRGLVSVERPGRYVQYYPESDPLVASAKPILRAMQETCRRIPASRDMETVRLAQGLSHEKRMALIRELHGGAQEIEEVRRKVGLSPQNFLHHVRFLEEGGWLARKGGKWELVRQDAPLAQCLLKLM